MTYPDGSTVVNRNYTAQGQLERASWGGGSVDYTYLRDGKLDHEAYGNGVRSDLGYNGRGFINLTNTYRQSQTYAKRDYWRDERDRIKGWRKGSDSSANPKENGRGDRYDYDDEGQMYKASYQVDVNGNGAERADWFNYDELGNRVRGNYIANRGAMDLKRRDNKLNQYESWENNYPLPPEHWGSGVFHDDNWSPSWVPPGNGVTIADGWITASYNALNQPVAMGNIGYGIYNYMWFWYDPLGRCVKRWIGTGDQTPVGATTYFYYDGWNLIQEGSTATAADRIYVHGNRVDEVVASAVGAGWLYHHYDARGHCILQTNAASGALQEQYDYDAFGWPYFYTAAGTSVPQSQSGNRFLFTGREFLADMRIYDYRNRMYQPELGRFLQPDPKQFDAGDYNLYRYCHNDPVNHADPTGLDTTRDFIAGAGDLITFGQGSKLAEALYPGYNATVNTDSGAYRAGQMTGLVLGMADGAGEVRIVKAAITGEKLLPAGSKVLAKVEKQLAEHGEKSLQKSLQSFEKRIAEHTGKIEQSKAAGGNTSSMQREIRAFEKERDAIKQVLEKKN